MSYTRVIYAVIGAVLLMSAGTAVSHAEGDDFHFSRVDFAIAVNDLARTKGIRAYLRQPHRCEQTEKGNRTIYFCEYWLLNVRTRLWSEIDGGPLVLVSAKVRPEDLGSKSVVALSLLISAIDHNLLDSEVSIVAERLSAADRTLTGEVSVNGKNARYVSRVERDGLAIIASK